MLCDTAGVGVLLQPLSTGSPFGHHPRLSIGCPRRGQWVSAQEDIPLTSTHAYHIWSCGYSHSSHRLTLSPHTVYGLEDTLTHCITYHSLRIPYMVLRILSPHSTLPPLLSYPHRAASGGGAPCVTAGDTRAERGGTRGKVDSTNLRRRRRRTESVEKVSSISPPRKNSFCCHVVTEIFNGLTNRRL